MVGMGKERGQGRKEMEWEGRVEGGVVGRAFNFFVSDKTVPYIYICGFCSCSFIVIVSNYYYF